MTPQHFKQRILDAWLDGRETRDIAASLNITRNTVLGIVYRARQAGLLKGEEARKSRKTERQKLKEPTQRRLPSPQQTHLPEESCENPKRELSHHPKDTIIAQLYAEGVSLRSIAKATKETLNKVNSRVAVLVKRGALKRRGFVINSAGKAWQKPMTPPEELAAGVPLANLQSHQCKWPLWGLHDPVSSFCGADRKEGSPYCCEHHAVAFVKLPQKARRKKRTFSSRLLPYEVMK